MRGRPPESFIRHVLACVSLASIVTISILAPSVFAEEASDGHRDPRDFQSEGMKLLEETPGDRGRQPNAGEPSNADEHITPEKKFGMHLVGGIAFGAAIPIGKFSNGFRTGGTGAAFLGVTGRRFGARLLMGSTEPGTRGPTNDAYSARLGRPVVVNEAIVPIELQGIAAFPTQTSRLAVTLQAGGGLHDVTVRLKNTDDRLDNEKLFGFSTGAGLRYNVYSVDRRPALSLGLNGVFHGSGSNRYATVELELVGIL